MSHDAILAAAVGLGCESYGYSKSGLLWHARIPAGAWCHIQVVVLLLIVMMVWVIVTSEVSGTVGLDEGCG